MANNFPPRSARTPSSNMADILYPGDQPSSLPYGAPVPATAGGADAGPIVADKKHRTLKDIADRENISGEDILNANLELADDPNDIPVGTELKRPQFSISDSIENGVKAIINHMSYKPITADQLKAAMPMAGKTTIDKFLEPLNEAMRKYDINTPERQSAFLAQIAQETGEMRLTKEGSDGSAYESNTKLGKKLGNTEPGDGPRFLGRGLLQTTGRANYAKTGEELGVDLLEHPELLEEPRFAALAAGWYFKRYGGNVLADRGNFRGLTGVVNGKEDAPATHLDRRIKYYNQARRTFGLSDWKDTNEDE